LTADQWNQDNINKLIGCALDNCQTTPLTVNSDYAFGNLSGACGATGTLTVTYTVTDECGNDITRTANLTITDNTDPVVECDPDNDQIECLGETGNIQAATSWNAANIAKLEGCSNDACGMVTVTSDFDYAVNFTINCGFAGAINVTYTITDQCDNAVSKTATYTIVDTTDPVVLCTPDDGGRRRRKSSSSRPMEC